MPKYIVTDIHREDSWYSDAEFILGTEIEGEIDYAPYTKPGFRNFEGFSVNSGLPICFHAIKVERVSDE